MSFFATRYEPELGPTKKIARIPKTISLTKIHEFDEVKPHDALFMQPMAENEAVLVSGVYTQYFKHRNITRDNDGNAELGSTEFIERGHPQQGLSYFDYYATDNLAQAVGLNFRNGIFKLYEREASETSSQWVLRKTVNTATRILGEDETLVDIICVSSTIVRANESSLLYMAVCINKKSVANDEVNETESFYVELELWVWKIKDRRVSLKRTPYFLKTDEPVALDHTVYEGDEEEADDEEEDATGSERDDDADSVSGDDSESENDDESWKRDDISASMAVTLSWEGVPVVVIHVSNYKGVFPEKYVCVSFFDSDGITRRKKIVDVLQGYTPPSSSGCHAHSYLDSHDLKIKLFLLTYEPCRDGVVFFINYYEIFCEEIEYAYGYQWASDASADDGHAMLSILPVDGQKPLFILSFLTEPKIPFAEWSCKDPDYTELPLNEEQTHLLEENDHIFIFEPFISENHTPVSRNHDEQPGLTLSLELHGMISGTKSDWFEVLVCQTNLYFLSYSEHEENAKLYTGKMFDLPYNPRQVFHHGNVPRRAPAARLLREYERE